MSKLSKLYKSNYTWTSHKLCCLGKHDQGYVTLTKRDGRGGYDTTINYLEQKHVTIMPSMTIDSIHVLAKADGNHSLSQQGPKKCSVVWPDPSRRMSLHAYRS